MVDEFSRIESLCRTSTMKMDEALRQEIIGLCERAKSDIKQRVPVIEQRDKAEQRLLTLGIKFDYCAEAVKATWDAWTQGGDFNTAKRLVKQAMAALASDVEQRRVERRFR